MKEKKKFFIPKNYDKKFEWIPGISGWQHLAFAPVVGLDYIVIAHTPFDFSNKLVMIAVSLAVPYILIGTHPIRENVSLYKHLVWKLKFLSRQRIFKYKKEGYVNVIQEKIESSTKGTGSSKEINPRFDTNKRDRTRITYNSRSKDDSMSESIGS